MAERHGSAPDDLPESHAASGTAQRVKALKTSGILHNREMPEEVELLKRLYDRFNARDMESVLEALCNDVIWANGMEGGYVHGRDGVRNYWTRQWRMVNPRVEPVEFSSSTEGEMMVEVHQVVYDHNGTLLVDKMVGHVFRIEKGLIKRFDIRGALGGRRTGS